MAGLIFFVLAINDDRLFRSPRVKETGNTSLPFVFAKVDGSRNVTGLILFPGACIDPKNMFPPHFCGARSHFPRLEFLSMAAPFELNESRDSSGGEGEQKKGKELPESAADHVRDNIRGRGMMLQWRGGNFYMQFGCKKRLSNVLPGMVLPA